MSLQVGPSSPFHAHKELKQAVSSPSKQHRLHKYANKHAEDESLIKALDNQAPLL